MYQVISFPDIGTFGFTENNGFLLAIDFLEGEVCGTSPKTDFQKLCSIEITEYFAGKRRVFSIPMVFHGTPFQELVWTVVSTIPFGETLTYSQIAERIGSPRACRAVGTAVGKNPLPIVIPCHRVVARTGLGGYRGGLSLKKTLLALEGLYY